MKTVVGFDPRTAEKLIQKVRNDKPRRQPGFSFPPHREAYLDAGTASATIPANSTGTAVSGYRTNQNGAFHRYEVVNIFSSEIDEGTNIIWARIATGQWLIIAADC